MTETLPPVRDRSEIMTAYCSIGGQEGRCESILHEGRRYLVLSWVLPAHGEWMQPRRAVLIEHLDFEIRTDPELAIYLYTPLPADARPEADPLETAKLTYVEDYPQTLFQPHRMN